jgi:hypothetical protein
MARTQMVYCVLCSARLAISLYIRVWTIFMLGNMVCVFRSHFSFPQVKSTDSLTPTNTYDGRRY